MLKSTFNQLDKVRLKVSKACVFFNYEKRPLCRAVISYIILYRKPNCALIIFV
jgi:hypothetical protein